MEHARQKKTDGLISDRINRIKIKVIARNETKQNLNSHVHVKRYCSTRSCAFSYSSVEIIWAVGGSSLFEVVGECLKYSDGV